MKKIVLASMLLIVATAMNAQVADTSYWKKGGLFNVSFNQVSLNNWASGGQNSLAVNGLVNVFLNYKKEKTSWDNSLVVGYGLINQAKLPWWEKSDDKLDITSKFGRSAFKHWSYSALVNFKTQFSPGYNTFGIPLDNRNIISDLFSPAYLILALGLDYKPNDNFSMMCAPLTGKITIVKNQNLADAGAFGVNKAKLDQFGQPITGTGANSRSEFGAYLKLSMKKNIMENISLSTKLELFSNYLNNPQNIDVNWEVLIAMKVNKFISVNLSTQMIYDDDINIVRDPDQFGVFQKNGPVLQFKEVLNIGFNLKF